MLYSSSTHQAKPGDIIGRAREANIRYTYPDTSRQHAKLHHDGSAWYIEDLGSMNGTQVNGLDIGDAMHPIAVGDTICCGSLLLDVGESISIADVPVADAEMATIG